jgi:phospholipid-binding lipoprotein MlaA
MIFHARHLLPCIALSALLLMGGCASATSPQDPLEPMNRKLYQANEVLDKYAVKPVVKAYTWALPQFVRTGVSNVFNNVSDLYSGINDLLQAKPRKAVDDFGRVAVNTTVGIVGLFDVASKWGLARGDEDFGQTLGYWGLGQGPYLFLPLFGPTTIRDGTGATVRIYTDPVNYIDDEGFRNGVKVLSVVDKRSQADDILNIVDKAALDRYRFIRSSYLQRRLYVVHDGEPPRTDDEE